MVLLITKFRMKGFYRNSRRTFHLRKLYTDKGCLQRSCLLDYAWEQDHVLIMRSNNNPRRGKQLTNPRFMQKAQSGLKGERARERAGDKLQPTSEGNIQERSYLEHKFKVRPGGRIRSRATNRYTYSTAQERLKTQG